MVDYANSQRNAVDSGDMNQESITMSQQMLDLMQAHPWVSVSTVIQAILTVYLQKQKGRTVYLLKNKAKKVRKVTQPKKYPILEKDKRQKIGQNENQANPSQDTSQIPDNQGLDSQVDLKDYFHEYNEQKKKDNPDNK